MELKDIIINNEFIINWDYEEVQQNCFLRFCYKKDDYKGFSFLIFDMIAEEIILSGESFFDGVRHLYFGDEQCDNFGYLYYPNLNDIILSLTILRRYELQYCDIEALDGDLVNNRSELITLNRDSKINEILK